MKYEYVQKETRIMTIFSIVILLTVIVINIVNLYHISSMYTVTKDIYEHPLKVSNAALNVEKSIVKIHMHMEHISVYTSDAELRDTIKFIDKEERYAYQYLEVIELNILGLEGLELYRKTFSLFQRWKGIRDEFLLLSDEKKNLPILISTQHKCNQYMQKIEKAAVELNKYAQNKADFFKAKAYGTFKSFVFTNIVLIVFTLGLFILSIFYIRNRLHKYMQLIAQNEERYKSLSERFELAIDGSNDGLWDWNVKEGTVYFSPRWKGMLGFRDEELVNTFDTWESRVHPEDLKEVKEKIELSHTDPSVEYSIVHRLKHKDGSWVWILDRGQTIFDIDGKAVRMLGFHTDITEQKGQEKKIEDLSLLLNNTLNSFNNLIFVKDNNFRYLECNKAFEKFIGIPREQLLGKDDYALFDKEIADLFRAKDIEMLEDGITKNNYEWVTYPDGKKVYLLTSKSPLHDENNTILGLVGNSIDVTREKALEQEILDKDEIMIAQSRHAAMGEMISMIAHQWRQPISVIAMDANNILVDVELDILDKDELTEEARDIIFQTSELSKTIDDFREFFKPNKNTESVLLKEVISDALNILGKSLENNNIDIVLNIDESIKITTFSRELMQVFINIIKNAKETLIEKKIEFKSIYIDLFKDNTSVIIEISDNAGGVCESIIGKIFDPYFTTKGEKNGTGLGLYMSKTIIEKHLNGSIVVSNMLEGAKFRIILPINLEV